MEQVLTLIANPLSLTQGTVDTVRDALGNLGQRTSPPDWLAPGEACDLHFTGLSADQADAAARFALGCTAVDVVVQPAEGRKKRLLLADMESTIIEQEMLDELGEQLGIRDRIAAITARAMNGEIDFGGALRERVALLKGLVATVLDEAAARITFTPGAAELVAVMRANGTHCVIVSGGFRHFTRLVVEDLGFHEDHANDLIIADGYLTGTCAEPIFGREDKLRILVETAAARGLALAQTLAVGDGANDVPMLSAAGLGIAFHAKPTVRAEARHRIDHADLRALLFAQGYRQTDIAQAMG